MRACTHTHTHRSGARVSTKAIVSSCKQTTPVKSVIQRLHIIFMLKIFVPVPYSLILKKIFLDPALCTVHVRVLFISYLQKPQTCGSGTFVHVEMGAYPLSKHASLICYLRGPLTVILSTKCKSSYDR